MPTNLSSKISCLINTKNSEEYLQEVLNSVKWADEIIVVDMKSSDRTESIVRSNGAKFLSYEDIGYVEPARAFGVDNCSHPWVLIVDSDEIVPKALADHLLEVAEKDLFDVVYFSFRNFFFGREILGTGWSYKDIRVPRFFKKGKLSFGDKIHSGFFIQSGARVLSEPSYEKSIIHFNYDSVWQFIHKLNSYTDFEAQKNDMYIGRPIPLMIYHFMRELGGRFLIKKGYRDGWVGLYLSFAMAFYRCSAIAKKNLPARADVKEKYKALANSTLVSERK